MVVFESGRPKPSEYRRFKIKSVEGPNDFASHQEVLRRRFRHAGMQSTTRNEDSADLEGQFIATSEDGAGETGTPGAPGAHLQHDWAIPDLVIIDGGKGQLSAAMEVIQDLHLDIPTVALAKENEEIFIPGSPDPIILPRSSQALYLVQRIRDEAHRFGLTYHRSLRGRKAIRSVLDEVPGIGPKRKAALLKRFGSVKGIRAASAEATSKSAPVNGPTSVALKT